MPTRSSSIKGRPLPWGGRGGSERDEWPPWVPPPATTSPSRQRVSPPPTLRRSVSSSGRDSHATASSRSRARQGGREAHRPRSIDASRSPQRHQFYGHYSRGASDHSKSADGRDSPFCAHRVPVSQHSQSSHPQHSHSQHSAQSLQQPRNFLSRIDSVLKEHGAGDPYAQGLESRRISPPRRSAPPTPVVTVSPSMASAAAPLSTPHRSAASGRTFGESTLLRELDDLDSALVESEKKRNVRLMQIIEDSSVSQRGRVAKRIAFGDDTEGESTGSALRDHSVSTNGSAVSLSSDGSVDFLDTIVRRQASLSERDRGKQLSSRSSSLSRHRASSSDRRSTSKPRTVPHPHRAPPPRPGSRSASVSSKDKPVPSPASSLRSRSVRQTQPAREAPHQRSASSMSAPRSSSRGRLVSGLAKRRIDFDMDSDAASVQSTQQGSGAPSAIGLRTVLDSLAERVKTKTKPLAKRAPVTPECDALLAEMVTYLDEHQHLDPLLQVCIASDPEVPVHAAAEYYSGRGCQVGLSLLRILGYTGEQNMLAPKLCKARRDRVTELVTIIIQ